MNTQQPQPAHFKCLNPDCKHEWKQPPSAAKCPQCQNKYVKWINYKDKK